MRFPCALFALVLAAAPARSADSNLPDCLPPGTKVLLGFSLRGLAESPMLKGWVGDLRKAGADFMKSSPLPGLDPLKDIDDVVIASTGDGDQAPMLVIIRGRFAMDSVPAAAARYHDVAVLTNPKDAGSVMALLDASTAIAGDLAQVHAAIDRRGSASTVPQALADSAHSLASRFDVWGVGDLPKGLPVTPGSPSQFDSLDHFEFGAALRQGLELKGQFHVRNVDDAQKLADSARLVEAMLKTQQGAGPASAAKLDLKTDQGTLKFSLIIPEEDLKRGLAANQSAIMDALKTRMQASATPKPKPSTKATIEKRENGDAVKLTLPGGR